MSDRNALSEIPNPCRFTLLDRHGSVQASVSGPTESGCTVAEMVAKLYYAEDVKKTAKQIAGKIEIVSWEGGCITAKWRS